MARRLGRQFLAALLLLSLWLGADHFFPELTDRWRAPLRALIDQSWDPETSFSRLGDQLRTGEDPLGSVGEWCVSVFLPQEVEVSAHEAP